MVHEFCTSWHGALNLCEVLSKYLKRYRVMEWTRVHGRNGYIQCSKGNNYKSRPTRVTVHVFCTSSDGALHLCEVS